MRVLGISYNVIIPVWLFIGLVAITSSTLASPTTLKPVNDIKTCRNSNEKEQCRAKCSNQVLQPLCIEQRCICDSIGDRDCSEDKNQACITFCKALNNQKFIGCYKDECICDKDEL